MPTGPCPGHPDAPPGGVSSALQREAARSPRSGVADGSPGAHGSWFTSTPVIASITPAHASQSHRPEVRILALTLVQPKSKSSFPNLLKDNSLGRQRVDRVSDCAAAWPRAAPRGELSRQRAGREGPQRA